MTTPEKRKGDKAELEVQEYLRRWFPKARRALGAGRADDVGDITGVPMVVQVANYRDLNRAVSEKLSTVAIQVGHSGFKWGGLWCRRRGGKFVVVMEPAEWVELVIAATEARA